MIIDFKILEIKLHNILFKLGIPTNVKGYPLIKEIIIEYLNNHYRTMSELYKIVGKKLNVPSNNVERNVRRAIHMGLSRTDKKEWKKYFGAAINLKNCPTNSEFISYICEYIKLHNKELFNENCIQKIF